MAQHADVTLDNEELLGVGESVLQRSILIYLDFVVYITSWQFRILVFKLS